MYKITLLIPTRERAQLLRCCLKTCLDQDWDNCEILISDNYSEDETKKIVDSFVDKLPIRYINPGKRLGMSEHWQFAIAQVKSEFLLIIGDDDGLPSRAIARMKAIVMSHPNTDAIYWAHNIFNYPDIPAPSQSGMFHHYGGNIIQTRSVNLTLRLYLAGHIYFYNLPGVYHKLARTSLVRSVIADGIKGIAPDVAIATAMSLKLNDYIYTRDPLSIPGISSSSNGFSTTSRNGNKDQASIFLRETLISIAEPFTNLSIPLESNINLMQLEVITKIRREGLINPSLQINYVKFIRNAYREATIGYPEKKTMFSEDLWFIYQSLCNETDSVCLTREELFLANDWRLKGSARWGHGEVLALRLSHDCPDIKAAMPVIEDCLAEATLAFTSTLLKILPKLSQHLHKRQITGVFLCLTEFECSLGSDLLHLVLSPRDLSQFLMQHFPDKDAADHAFSLAYSYYLVFEHLDSDPDMSEKLKAISIDLDPVRFQLMDSKLLSTNWPTIAAAYLEIWPKAFKLRAMGLHWVLPTLIKIKKYLDRNKADFN